MSVAKKERRRTLKRIKRGIEVRANSGKFVRGQADGYYAWQWIGPVLDAFLQSADDQQVHLVNTFFKDLDFRRFQVDLNQPIEMDDTSKIPRLVVYGEELGRKILNDMVDPILNIKPTLPLPHLVR